MEKNNLTAMSKSADIDLTKSFKSKRSISNTLFTWFMLGCGLIACIPLFSILYMLVIEGAPRLNWETLTALPPVGFETGGGIGNAIVGTLVMVGIASVISIPMGILAAVYINEIAPNSALAKGGKFLARVLTGLPSILAGVFAYAAVVIVLGTYSAIAGGIALAILMVPTVILTTAEALKSVPQKMKDAAYGLGCTRSQVVWKIVLPTAFPSIITGVLLAVAGAAGESAPLLFTALFSNYHMSDLNDPTASLSILIYNFSGLPFPNQIELAWTASLVLVLIILIFNILARLVGRRKF
ncbi:Phosphate transport system permease protein PstA [Sinobacterium norvegicum]|uniref:Phosphate transport system permease protein PstA n=1 Tax=Sinobacterium norvegicum TaxID=1641715 RepID=A0ABN8EIN5_9GAMM|nr:phosphate ABC transporter permease PstA [Sinobacterium norvegicum]CAH0991035.1 Phosphate transport system permease protein PstA [Sinobacterium norvegicum]